MVPFQNHGRKRKRGDNTERFQSCEHTRAFFNGSETVIEINYISALWQPAIFCQVEKNKDLALNVFIF